MKAITLYQPYATLIQVGAKKIETRGWPTTHRGLLAIHSAKRIPNEDLAWLIGSETGGRILDALGAAGYYGLDELPLGKILCTVNLVDCARSAVEHLPPEPERSFGLYCAGRWMWRLADVRTLPEPIPCRGAQRLWTVPPEIEAQLAEVLKR